MRCARHSSCLRRISDSEAWGRCPSDYNLLLSCVSLSKFRLWWRRERRLSWGKRREGRPWWIFSVQGEADCGREELPDSHFKGEQWGLFSPVICGAIGCFFQPPSHGELLKWNLNVGRWIAGIESELLQPQPAQLRSALPHVAPPSLLSNWVSVLSFSLLITRLRTTAANSSCELYLAM